MTKILVFIALICSALVTGLTLTHVLQAPGSATLTGPAWLAVQHTFYGGFAVIGGVGEIVGFLAAAVLASVLFARHRTQTAIGPTIAALAMLGTLLAYWFGNRPVNALVASWMSATLPPDWPAYRGSWEAAHALSSGLAAVAFIALAIVLIWGRRDALLAQ